MPNHHELTHRLAAHGQEHLLRWWPALTDQQRERLAAQIDGLDLKLVANLYHQHRAGKALSHPLEHIEPAPVIRLSSSDQAERDRRARRRGIESLRAGKLAAVLVAGGQGTRLGFDLPKGMFPIWPTRGTSVFQILCEKMLATSRRYGVEIPYYVMTSAATHDATVRFFEEQRYFGLDPQQVMFFEQGAMPSVDRASGKVLLTEQHQIALSPNGHGGALAALADEGPLADMRRRGVETIYYHQVDNVLANVLDPLFIGHYLEAGADAAVKVVPKLGPTDTVGNLVQVDGKTQIIEYSELPVELAHRPNPDRTLWIWAGSTAIHLFDVALLERLARDPTALPYHAATKVVAYVDEHGRKVTPREPNALKFERFIFDILPRAEKCVVVETTRHEEYDPLKNASGPHSPESVRQSLSTFYADWLQSAGVEVPRLPDGGSAVAIEISPLYALDRDELREKYAGPRRLTEPTHLG